MTSWFRWPWQARQHNDEALAAKIHAQIQQKAAEEQFREEKARADRIEARAARNHISEDLTRAFQGGAA